MHAIRESEYARFEVTGELKGCPCGREDDRLTIQVIIEREMRYIIRIDGALIE